MMIPTARIGAILSALHDGSIELDDANRELSSMASHVAKTGLIARINEALDLSPPITDTAELRSIIRRRERDLST